jgi:hypothetical protein
MRPSALKGFLFARLPAPLPNQDQPMRRLALVIQVSGEVDYEDRNPVLTERSGRRWRLENASGLLSGDQVTVAATKEDFSTLLVRALVHNEWHPAAAKMGR